MLAVTVFSENFESGTFNASKWSNGVFGTPVVLREGTSGGPLNSPNGIYALNLDGCCPSRGEAINSNTLNLTRFKSATLSYRVQAGGNGDDPDTNDPGPSPVDNLYSVYKRSPTDSSRLIERHNIANTSDTGFEAVSFEIPSSALTSTFYFGFSAAESDYFDNGGFFGRGYPEDDWYIDDIKVVGVLKTPTVTLGGVSGNKPDNSGYTLSWSATDSSGTPTVSAKLFRNGSQLYSSSSRSSSFTVTPSLGLGDYKLRVTATNRYGGTDTKERSFKMVDNDPYAPTITLGGSSGDESPLATQEFTWDVTDDSGISYNLVTISGPDGLKFETEDTSGSFNFDDFGGPGVFQISVTATDNDLSRGVVDRATGTKTRTVTVLNETPVAAAGNDLPDEIEGTAVLFDGTQSSDANGLIDIASYEWDFGDGSTGTGETTSHVYADDGTYNVRLTVTDRQNTSSEDTLIVTVANAIPIVTSLPFVTGKTGDTLNFTSIVDEPGSADVVTYVWDLGDGTELSGVERSAVSHAYAADGTYVVSLTVTDDEGATSTTTSHAVLGPPITFTMASQQISEDGGSVTIEAQLAQVLTTDVTVPLVLSGTAREFADYRLADEILVIPAGSLSVTTTVDILEDVLSEDTETIVVSMGLPEGVSHGAIADQVISITDNDPLPRVSFTSLGQSVEEDAGTITLSARLSEVAGRDVVVPLTFDGSANPGSDYDIPANAQIVIPEGSLIGSIAIDLTDDNLGEAPESIIATMQPSNQATLSQTPGDPLVHTVIIPLNDTPAISFASAGKKVSELDGDIVIKARLSNPADGTITVPLSASPDSTANANDYSFSQSVLVFAPGETEIAVVVSVIDDANAATVPPSEISMTQRYGTANPLDGLRVEGGYSSPALGDLDGDGDIDLISGTASGELNYFKNIGSKTAPAFLATPVSFLPPPGMSAATFSKPTLGDLNGDGVPDLLLSYRESGFYYFENTGGSFEYRDTFAVTSFRRDDDDFPAATLGDVDGDGDLDLLFGTAGYSQTHLATRNRYRFIENTGTTTTPNFDPDESNLDTGLGEFVAPRFASQAFGDFDGDGDLDVVASNRFLENIGTTTEPNYFERFGVFNPVDGKLLQRPAVGDLDGDGDLDLVTRDGSGFKFFETEIGSASPVAPEETLNEFLVLGLLPSDDALLGETRSYVLEIKDDDVPLVSLDPINNEWEDVGTITVSATLSRPSNNDVIVPVAFAGDYASDMQLQESHIVISAGSLFGTTEITVVDDNEDEFKGKQQEAFTIQMASPANAFKADSDWTRFKLLDNDPIIRFASDSAFAKTTSPEGDTVTYYARPAYRINKPINISYEITPGNASEGSDYIVLGPSKGDATIPAFQSGEQIVSIQFVDDNIVERKIESFHLEFSAVGFSLYDSNTEREPRPSLRNRRYGTTRILDNDKLGLSISFTASGANHLRVLERSSVIPFTVRLTNPVDRDIRVFVESVPGHHTADTNDFAFISTELHIPAGGVVATGSIKLHDDNQREALERIVFRASSMSAAGDKVVSENAEIAIVDTDLPATVTIPQNTLAVDTASELSAEALLFPALGTAISNLAGSVNDGGCGINTPPLTICIYNGSDGYISGGLAFFDGNKNGVFDFLDMNGNNIQDLDEPTEPNTLTAADGTFALAIPAEFDRNLNGLIDEQDGSLVLTGGVDSSTGLPLGLSLTAPAGFLAITPVTTLVNELVRNGMTAEAAQIRVMEAVGINPTELRALNPIAAHLDFDSNATDLVAAGAMIQDTVVQIAEMVSGVAAAPPFEFVAARVFEDIAAKITDSGSSLNLTLAPVVASIIDGTLFRSAVALDSAIVSGAASIISEGNQHIHSLGTGVGEIYLRNVARTQSAAQGIIADALSAVGSGTEQISDVEMQFTGEGLQATIASSSVQNVLPPVIAITDSRQLETDGETTFEFTVMLLRESALPVSVDFTTDDYEAVSGEGDYVTASGTLNWDAGDNTERTIQVTVNGDSDFELDESFLVILSNATNAALRKDIGLGTITNDDALTYNAPNGMVANQINIKFENGNVELRSNGVTVLEGPFINGTPITIVGATDVSNELFVQIIGDNPVLDGGVHFQGGSSLDDALTIFDGLSEMVVHSATDSGEGTFDIDGSIFSYASVESATDKLAPTINGLDVSMPEATLISLGSTMSEIHDPESLTYAWSITADGDVVTTSSLPTVEFLPPDNRSYAVELVVTSSEFGTVGTHRVTLDVHNVIPGLTLVEDPTVDEGSLLSLSNIGVITDPGFDNPNGSSSETFTYSVNWGDGTAADTGSATIDNVGSAGELTNASFDGSHIFADDGFYTVTVRVADDDMSGDFESGTSGIDYVEQTFQVTVGNVAPTIDAGDDQTTLEGTLISLAPSTFNDLGTLDTHTATIDWGDGSPIEAGLVSESPFGPPGSTAGADGTIAGSHVYADNGIYVVAVTVIDDEGATTSDSLTVTVGNVAPTLDAGADQTTLEGTLISLDPSAFNDLGTLDSHSATIDWGDGSPVEAGLVTESPFGPGGFVLGADGTIAGSHVYADNGIYTVTVTVTDDEGAATSDTLKVTVGNVAPTIDAGADQTTLEGTLISLDPSVFNDLGTLDSHTATIDWGDGSPVAAGVVTESPFGPEGSVLGADGTIAGSHVYADNGIYTVTVTVTDDDGAATSDALTVAVGNVRPSIDGASLTNTSPSCGDSHFGDSITVSVDFSDPGFDNFALGTSEHFLLSEIDWGDGTVQTVASIPALTVLEMNGADGTDTTGSITGTHAYANGGVYEVTVTVRDDDGGMHQIQTTVMTAGHNVVNGTLYIVGTEGRDHVQLKFDEKKDELKVDVKLDKDESDGKPNHLKWTYPASSIGRIVAYLCGGDDHYDGGSDGGSDGDADTAASQFVFGGTGDDKIQGGRGNDVLSGGEGNDDLKAGTGFDILIGGFGKDKLKGGRGNDLLIGDSAANENNLVALEAALAEWVGNASDRLEQALIDLGPLTEDGDKDDLKGEKGDDELLGSSADKLKA